MFIYFVNLNKSVMLYFWKRPLTVYHGWVPNSQRKPFKFILLASSFTIQRYCRGRLSWKTILPNFSPFSFFEFFFFGGMVTILLQTLCIIKFRYYIMGNQVNKKNLTEKEQNKRTTHIARKEKRSNIERQALDFKELCESQEYSQFVQQIKKQQAVNLRKTITELKEREKNEEKFYRCQTLMNHERQEKKNQQNSECELLQRQEEKQQMYEDYNNHMQISNIRFKKKKNASSFFEENRKQLCNKSQNHCDEQNRTSMDTLEVLEEYIKQAKEVNEIENILKSVEVLFLNLKLKLEKQEPTQEIEQYMNESRIQNEFLNKKLIPVLQIILFKIKQRIQNKILTKISQHMDNLQKQAEVTWKINHEALQKINANNMRVKDLTRELEEKRNQIEELKESLNFQEQITKKIRQSSILKQEKEQWKQKIERLSKYQQKYEKVQSTLKTRKEMEKKKSTETNDDISYSPS